MAFVKKRNMAAPGQAATALPSAPGVTPAYSAPAFKPSAVGSPVNSSAIGSPTIPGGNPWANIKPGSAGISPKDANPHLNQERDDARAKEDALYADIMKSHQGAWGGIESGVAANQAQMQRRSAAMSAAMGRSVGGGFASGMAQAGVTGQQNLMNARLQHEQQGRNLQLDWLDKQIRRRERDEDLEAEAARTENDVPGSELPAAGSSGGGSALSNALAQYNDAMAARAGLPSHTTKAKRMDYAFYR